MNQNINFEYNARKLSDKNPFDIKRLLMTNDRLFDYSCITAELIGTSIEGCSGFRPPANRQFFDSVQRNKYFFLRNTEPSLLYCVVKDYRDKNAQYHKKGDIFGSLNPESEKSVRKLVDILKDIETGIWTPCEKIFCESSLDLKTEFFDFYFFDQNPEERYFVLDVKDENRNICIVKKKIVPG